MSMNKELKEENEFLKGFIESLEDLKAGRVKEVKWTPRKKTRN